MDYHREHLRRLLFDEPVVDTTVADRIDRSIGHLRQAAATRDTHRDAVLAALAELQSASPARSDTSAAPDLPAPDTAALLAIARGAKLYENLLTQRLSVITASGTRIAYSALQRLEAAGLVARDASRPVHAGVPLTLTEAGRATLSQWMDAALSARGEYLTALGELLTSMPAPTNPPRRPVAFDQQRLAARLSPRPAPAASPPVPATRGR